MLASRLLLASKASIRTGCGPVRFSPRLIPSRRVISTSIPQVNCGCRRFVSWATTWIWLLPDKRTFSRNTLCTTCRTPTSPIPARPSTSTMSCCSPSRRDLASARRIQLLSEVPQSGVQLLYRRTLGHHLLRAGNCRSDQSSPETASRRDHLKLVGNRSTTKWAGSLIASMILHKMSHQPEFIPQLALYPARKLLP